MFPGVVGILCGGVALKIWYNEVCKDNGSCYMSNTSDKVFHLFFLFVIAFIIYVVSAAIGHEIAYNSSYQKELIYDIDSTVDIYSLKNSETYTGNFFLGCGSIDGNVKYYTYVKNEDDTLSLKSFYNDKFRIKEVENIDQPHIDKITPYVVTNNLKWLFGIKKASGSSYYIAYVPTGTVIKEYRVD